MSCFFEKNVYYPHEVARASAVFDNTKCQLDIDQTTLTLVREVSIRADHHRSHITTNVAGVQQDGVRAGETGERQMELELHKIQQENKFEVNRQRKKGKMYTNEEMELASMMLPCVKGKLIQCEYFLQVKPSFGGCDCCNNSPTIRLPLTLCHPEVR